MFSKGTAVLFTFIILHIYVFSTAGQDAQSASKIKIGTYNSRCVALAWGRSKEQLGELNKLYAECKKAKDANDKNYQKLKDELMIKNQQMHLQVFSNARIDNIIEEIRPRLGEIAKNAGVVMIVEEPVYKNAEADIELVDVTMLMANEFKPDEKTLEMIKNLPKSKPLSFEKAMKLIAEDKL